MEIKTKIAINYKILLIALLIRLLLIPFFYHPDIKSQNFHFQFLSLGHFNIYQHISDNKLSLPYRDTFNYLPLTYFTFGTIQAVLKPIMPPDFTLWINDWGIGQNNYPNLPYILLILKIPYLILDVFLALILLKISGSKLLFYFWLFNPISFYFIYILQNFDIVPVFLTVLSFYFLKSKPRLSFCVFGIAIALKLYPILFLPFFLLSQNRNIKNIIKYAFITFIPVIVSILPFMFSTAFWQSFLGSGLTQKILELKLLNISVFPIIYIIILLLAFFSKKFLLTRYIFFLFLLFISTVNFHPQWLLWFYPFILLSKNIFKPSLLIFIICIFCLAFFYIFLFNDNYLFFGHFIVIDPEFLYLRSPHELIRYRFLQDPQIIQKYLKSFISIFSLFTIYIYEKSSVNS